MYFEPNPVDSKAEKRAFLSHKTNNISHFMGSDPTGNKDMGPTKQCLPPGYAEYKKGFIC
jgi:hypothetical protein